MAGIVVAGHRADRDNEITLTPQQALRLARVLMVEASEAEDHETIRCVSVVGLANDLEPIVFRLNPHLG